MVVAVAFFTASAEHGVVDSTVTGGTELAGEAGIANWALAHLNRRHLSQGSRRLGCHRKFYVMHGSFNLVRVVFGPQEQPFHVIHHERKLLT